MSKEESGNLGKDTIQLVMNTKMWEQSLTPQGGNVVYQHPVIEDVFLRMSEEDSSERWKELMLHPITLGAFIMAQMDAKNVVVAVLDWFNAEYELATNEQVLDQSLYILLSDDELMDQFKVMANGGVTEYHHNLLAMISLRMIEALKSLFETMQKKDKEKNNRIEE